MKEESLALFQASGVADKQPQVWCVLCLIFINPLAHHTVACSELTVFKACFITDQFVINGCDLTCLF